MNRLHEAGLQAGVVVANPLSQEAFQSAATLLTKRERGARAYRTAASRHDLEHQEHLSRFRNAAQQHDVQRLRCSWCSRPADPVRPATDVRRDRSAPKAES